jgi:hypothetical protein
MDNKNLRIQNELAGWPSSVWNSVLTDLLLTGQRLELLGFRIYNENVVIIDTDLGQNHV